jgi:hypothetical protein
MNLLLLVIMGHANKTQSLLSLLLGKEAGLDSRQILDQPPYYHPIKL